MEKYRCMSSQLEMFEAAALERDEAWRRAEAIERILEKATCQELGISGVGANFSKTVGSIVTSDDGSCLRKDTLPGSSSARLLGSLKTCPWDPLGIRGSRV